MELKAYYRILIGKRWIVLGAFLITFIATLLFTFSQPWVYRATATFVVRVGIAYIDDRDFVSALDTLSRRAEIASTYAEVANSRRIKNLAGDDLLLTSAEIRKLSVDSRLIAGTNILEITVHGQVPALVRDFTNAIGAQTVAYVETLYEAYELEPLDEALLPTSPVKPDRALNLALGGIFGLILGAGLAFLSEYLQTPLVTATNFSVLDEETGAYSKPYFMLRLRQEMSRAKHNNYPLYNYPLSVALINVNHPVRMDGVSSQISSETLRGVAALLMPELREEDMMARFSDNVFAFLLPHMPGGAAKKNVEGLLTKMGSTPVESNRSGVKVNVHGTAGVVAYPKRGIGQEELLAQARRALENAEPATDGKVCLFSELTGRD